MRSEIGLAKDNKSNHFVFKHRLASGELRDVEVFASPIEANGRTLIHSIIHDITEKNKAEAELERMVTQKETLMKEPAAPSLSIERRERAPPSPSPRRPSSGI